MRGTTTSNQGKKFRHHAIFLCTIPTGDGREILEGQVNTSTAFTTTSEISTRQLFLSSVCSRFASIFAITSGANVPQLATAMECNEFDTSKICEHFSGNQPAIINRPIVHVLSMTLRSLPVSGCWAATITVSQTLDGDDGNIDDDDYFSYLAVVDTGSPFLTAPSGAFANTKKISRTMTQKKKNQTKRSSFLHYSVRNNDRDVSFEQYGSTVGSIQWRMAPNLSLIGNGNVEIENIIGNSRVRCKKIAGHLHPAAIDRNFIPETEIKPVIIQDQTDFVLGFPSDEVIAETGGIFLGLMAVDAARPTPLQQLGYTAFAMRFRGNDSNLPDHEDRIIRKRIKATNSNSPATLILWNGNQKVGDEQKKSETTASLIDRFDPFSMKLFDLTPYGPNLHHYGVLCDRFECWWGEKDRFDAVSFDCKMENDVNSCKPVRASLPEMSLSRPLVAVFDTGLSGCIFSDTLWDEIQLERRRLQQYEQDIVGSKDPLVDTNDENHSGIGSNEVGLSGNRFEEVPPIGCTVWLPTIGSCEGPPNAKAYLSPSSAVKLSSTSNYWRFQSFRLPWWYADTKNRWNVETSEAADKNYPHVVVLGSAFWMNPNIVELAIDTTSKRAKIRTVEQQEEH
jgi:hypothetical protein